MTQKDIWLIDFNPVKGSEQRGVRPGVVISGNAMNDNLGIAIVCPLSSKIKFYAGCSILRADTHNGLNTDSEVLVFQVRTVSKERFVQKLGVVNDTQLGEILKGLNEILTY